MKCPYRADKECNKEGRIPYEYCTHCLEGQKIDAIDLFSIAIANLTASIEESLCRQTIDRFEEIAKKYPKIEERLCREEQK